MNTQNIDFDKEEQEEDIDKELGNEEVNIEVPFKPSDVKVETRPMTLGQVVDMLEHGEIKMDTEFQRLAHLWSDVKKSRFIESLLLNLPIPTFYFDSSDNNNWRIIDGLQRVSTLESFVEKQDLKLQNLEFLREYEGKTFAELPRDLQRRIKGFPITAYILQKGTPNEVKFNIFKRINQGGLVLTPQEIRHAIHQGNATKWITELVSEETKEGKSFRKVTEGKVKTKRMQDRDFATRFVSFYLIPYQSYQPDLDSFMNKGLSAFKSVDNQTLQKLKNDFKKAMNTAWDIFGNDAFRKRLNMEDNRKPINKALFEVLSVNFAHLSEDDCQKLIQRKSILRQKLMTLHHEDSFFWAISRATAQKENVLERFKSIEKIIKETLEEND